ncbi:MAG: PCRF domain-containing protein, partial [Flavisolibacter sp.]|nr:PCRF domain-containing protein [Flavisolibacter sp.]
MIDRLEAIKARFDEIGVALTNPEVIANNKRFGEYSKEYRNLEKIVQTYNEYRKVLDDVAFYREALHGSDEEMRELAKMELPEAEENKEKLESRIRQMLIPKDPQDEK